MTNLEGEVGVPWLKNEVVKEMGNGRRTSFWKDHWVGEMPLCDCFPRLYSISNQREEMVGEVSFLREGSVEWILTWRREPFLWESELIANLMTVVADFRIGEDEDTWRWRPGW